MSFVKLIDGTPVSVEARPRWFNDDGSLLTDEQLMDQGYFPLDRAPVSYDPVTQHVTEKPIAEWAVLTDKVQVAYTVHAYDAGSVKQNLRDYAYAKRKEIEAQGFECGGMTISIDDTSKVNLAGARIRADANPSFTTKWKSPDGTFSEITAATIIAVSDAALDRVDLLFRQEGDAVAGIESGTITTATEVDAIFEG